MRYMWLIGVLLFTTLTADAQTTFEDATPIRFSTPVNGRLDGVTLREVYSFDGRRGEFITLTLTITDGNIDPVVTVLNSTGAVLALQDDGLGKGVFVDALRIPRNAVYYVVVTRWGGAFGITGGGYELTLERVGVSSQSGSSLRYSDTIINTVTDSNPQLYYSFRAQRGDILNISMQRISGDLDPYLQIVNSASAVIASSDDIPGSSTLDAAVEGLIIEQDGTYVIVATRYGEGAGTTSGSFVLSLEETDNSGLGNTIQTAAQLPDGEFVQGEITGTRYEQYYTFIGRENDLIRLQMDRLSGSLDAYIALLDPDLREITINDDGGGGQNAALTEYRLPRDGLYTVRATRFGGEDGTTVGRYRLQLERLGGAFENAAPDTLPVRYGSTVTGVITEEQDAVLYAFYGQQGDVITASMNRGDGNLDPFLTILGENLEPLRTDDDGGGGQNARIERFVLSRTGVYYIRAGRYAGIDGDPNTRGGFILVLAQVND